jgi:hydrogenase nickel incorporation protein HypA/HybF
MHELSIAMSILDAVAEQSQQRGGARITAVHVKVGPLSGVVADALQGAFDMARLETNFADCNLVIEQTPVLVHCPRCDADHEVKSIQKLACSVCGTLTAHVVGGRELEVCAMEIIE